MSARFDAFIRENLASLDPVVRDLARDALAQIERAMDADDQHEACLVALRLASHPRAGDVLPIVDAALRALGDDAGGGGDV